MLPDNAFIDVADHRSSLSNNQQEGDMSPSELSELIAEVSLLERQGEHEESSDPHQEADELVVGQELNRRYSLITD